MNLPAARSHAHSPVPQDARRALRLLACLAWVFGFGWAAAPALADAPPQSDQVAWQPWSDALFARARAENRLVLLDLEAVWCHWCHVMHRETYADPRVLELLARHYLAARVDQDARPDLARRFERWGWPATIIFAPDGKELIKRAGFIPPGEFAALLERTARTPGAGAAVGTLTTPNVGSGPTSDAKPGPAAGPSPASDLGPESGSDAAPAPDNRPALDGAGGLSPGLRARLQALHRSSDDPQEGGLKTRQKFIDADSVEYSLWLAGRGQAAEAARARRTLDAALALLDPAWGGAYQYSTGGRWDRPHFEKIMSTQAAYLRAYTLGGLALNEPRHLEAAERVAEYLNRFLKSPDGAFYTSQDADVVPGEKASAYFKLDDAARRAIGLPRVDTHRYARENGWVIEGLALLYAATGRTAHLDAARRAADWVLKHRALTGGGFGHGRAGAEAGGPFLGDMLAMGRAFLALYQVSAGREWLTPASAAADFIEARFRRPAVT